MSELDTLIRLLAKLPGLGPRSARRAALHLIKRRESLLEPLAAALAQAGRGDADLSDLRQSRHGRALRDLPRPAKGTRPRSASSKNSRISGRLERTGAFRGRYHVLGGTLSALDGVGPEDLNIERLLGRLKPGQELILALNATVEGQTTAHYLAERVAGRGVKISRLAQGVPIGGELDYLDDGTLTAALKARRAL